MSIFDLKPSHATLSHSPQFPSMSIPFSVASTTPSASSSAPDELIYLSLFATWQRAVAQAPQLFQSENLFSTTAQNAYLNPYDSATGVSPVARLGQGPPSAPQRCTAEPAP